MLTKHSSKRPRILIGKDTRKSGDMLEAALTAGLCSMGAKVIPLGVVPTPAVAYLTRYSSPEILANGAINGAILENYVVSEIIKTYHNNAKECLIWYYRDTNSNEIDLVIESDGMLHPIEIKRTASPGTELIKPFKLLDKASVPRGKGAIICMKETLSAVDSDNYIVPIWMI